MLADTFSGTTQAGSPTLTPLTGNPQTDQAHTVTATALDGGSTPVSGTHVIFTVTAGREIGATVTCTVNLT